MSAPKTGFLQNIGIGDDSLKKCDEAFQIRIDSLFKSQSRKKKLSLILMT